MSKNTLVINNILELIDKNINKENIEYCRYIISKKNELLTDKELDNINNLLNLIIKDKSIIHIIKSNCDLIFLDNIVNYNDIEYIIKICLCLVDLFNN